MTYKKYIIIEFPKRYFIEILLSLITISTIIISFSDFEKHKELLAVSASLVALIFLINNNKLKKKKIFHELFTHFNERYDKLNEEMNAIHENKNANIDNHYNNNPNRKYKDIIYDYLNLCAEEYFWKGQGLVIKEAWENWSKGIEYFLKINVVVEVIIEEKANIEIKDDKNMIKINDFYYGFLYSEVVNNAIAKYNDCKNCKENEKSASILS